MLFRHLVVPLDRFAPRQGAFAFALEWAAFLEAPLHAVAPSSALPGGCAQVDACAAACACRGIRWELVSAKDNTHDGFLPPLQPSDLLVLGHYSSAPGGPRRDRHLLSDLGSAVAFCPAEWTPFSRMLLLDDRQSSRPLLAAVARLAGCFRTTPVVLTAARGVRVAAARQRLTREGLTAAGLHADYDLVAGSDVRSAAVHVARWRNSSLVVMGRQRECSWWHWLRRRRDERLVHLLSFLAVLVLPDDMPSVIRGEESGLAPAVRDLLPVYR